MISSSSSSSNAVVVVAGPQLTHGRAVGSSGFTSLRHRRAIALCFVIANVPNLPGERIVVNTQIFAM